MRKIIYLLTLLLGVSLAACSDETIPEQPEKQEPPRRKSRFRIGS
jgi:endoglucanase